MSEKKNGIRHAKLDEELYLEMWRLSFCKISTAEIAERLGVGIPTYNRFKKRMAKVSASGALKILYDTAQQIRVPEFLNYDFFIASVSNFYNGTQPVEFADYHDCISNCDLRLSPRQFTKTHTFLRDVSGEKYSFKLIDLVDPQVTAEELDRFRQCKYCKLKVFRDHSFSVFQADLYLYAQLMYELSLIRQRNFSDQDALLLYFSVAIGGLMDLILLKTIQDHAQSGGDIRSAHLKAEAIFIDVTSQMWGEYIKGL